MLDKLKNNPHTQKRNKGYFKAQGANAAVLAAGATGSLGFHVLSKNISKCDNKDSVIIKNSAKKALEHTSLNKEGVELLYLSENNLSKKDLKALITGIKKFITSKNTPQALETFNNTIEKIAAYNKQDQQTINSLHDYALQAKEIIRKKVNISDKQIEKEAEKFIKIILLPFKKGVSCGYAWSANKIIMPDKSFQARVFHELGHAIINNSKGILKQNSDIIPIAKKLPAVFLAITLLSSKVQDKNKIQNKTKEKNKEKGIKSRIKNFKLFIKNNAIKLSAICMFPRLIDEAAASIKGVQVAKSMMNEDLINNNILKKVKKTNLLAFATCLISSISIVAGAKLAIKIKDKIQQKQELRQKENIIKRNNND